MTANRLDKGGPIPRPSSCLPAVKAEHEFECLVARQTVLLKRLHGQAATATLIVHRFGQLTRQLRLNAYLVEPIRNQQLRTEAKVVKHPEVRI